MVAAFESVSHSAGTPIFVSQQGTTLAPGSITFTGDAIPAGSGTGWLAVIFWGNADDLPPLYDDDVWTFCGDVEGGEGTWVADSGTRHISIYWHEGGSTPSNLTFTNGGANDPGNMLLGQLIRCTKTLSYWEIPQVAGNGDDVGGATFSVTLNRDPGGEVNDLGIWATIANTDAVNPAGLTLTWPGVTHTATAIGTTPSAAGHDSRVNTRRSSLTAGGSTGDVPTITSSTIFTGAAILARLRDTNTLPTPPPVASAPTGAIVEPWIDFPLDGSASTYLPGATFAWTDETVGGTGTVVIDDPTELVTTAHVDPTVWADEDYTFQLEITDAGGTDAVTVTKTVLRASTITNIGGVDRPMRRITGTYP